MRNGLILFGIALIVFLAGGLVVSSIRAANNASGQLPEVEQGSGDMNTELPEIGKEPSQPSPNDPGDVNPTPLDLRSESPPRGALDEFSTDFSRHTVSYGEILSGGPPKDGIPALDNPSFVSVQEADGWLGPQEPVVFFQLGDDPRAYPLQILTWHEIVNDVVDERPVTITFCPLCNTAIAFERIFDGQVLDFGTTGRLRFSNLIMYDRQTETWWQQASGEAIAGRYAGQRLTFLPAAIISWADFKESQPDGRVLSRDTGFFRDYGRNPYSGYDDINSSPFLFRGPDNSDRLPPMARVLTMELNGETVAYPFDVLSEKRVVEDSVGGIPVAVFWEPGTASALDRSALAEGRDVGAANAFSRDLDGQALTFRWDGDRILDDQTNSTWDVLGRAMDGPLAGSQLETLVSVNHFWFSWAAFQPETRIFRGR